MAGEILAAHIKKIISIGDEEVNKVISYFSVRSFKKKETLSYEGHQNKELYFVTSGCMRMFYLEEKGTEQTIQFAIENWWMTDLSSFNGSKPADFSIQAIEATEVMLIKKDDLDRLLQAHPKMERYFHLIYQRAYGAALLRIKYIFSMSKEEFYDHFSTTYPGFMQRVPQYILASFMGFTPEYLSELRRKKLHS